MVKWEGPWFKSHRGVINNSEQFFKSLPVFNNRLRFLVLILITPKPSNCSQNVFEYFGWPSCVTSKLTSLCLSSFCLQISSMHLFDFLKSDIIFGHMIHYLSHLCPSQDCFCISQTVTFIVSYIFSVHE